MTSDVRTLNAGSRGRSQMTAEVFHGALVSQVRQPPVASRARNFGVALHGQTPMTVLSYYDALLFHPHHTVMTSFAKNWNVARLDHTPMIAFVYHAVSTFPVLQLSVMTSYYVIDLIMKFLDHMPMAVVYYHALIVHLFRQILTSYAKDFEEAHPALTSTNVLSYCGALLSHNHVHQILMTSHASCLKVAHLERWTMTAVVYHSLISLFLQIQMTSHKKDVEESHPGLTTMTVLSCYGV